MVKKVTTSQPYTITAGPPVVSPNSNNVLIPVMIEMIENETPKFCYRRSERARRA